MLPAFGGDTLWASGIAAYEALSEPLKVLLNGLTATMTSSSPSRWSASANTWPKTPCWEETRKKNPPLSHPVVRTHPVSGRKSPFVSEGFYHQDQ